MWFEALIVVLAAANVYLWLLNRRVDALPANAPNKEGWLKDEPLQLNQSDIKKE